MKPQPPVTRMRIAARTSSDTADVKHHRSRKRHDGNKGQRLTENEFPKQILDAAFVIHNKWCSRMSSARKV